MIKAEMLVLCGKVKVNDVVVVVIASRRLAFFTTRARQTVCFWQAHDKLKIPSQ